MNLYQEEQTVTATEETAGKRVDVVLSAALSMSRSAVQHLLDAGAVTKAGETVSKSLRVEAGDSFAVSLPPVRECEVRPENIPLDIVYEDNDIVVVNKPQGMVVHPAPGHTDGTLVSALLYHTGDSLSDINGIIRPGIVHRIDRDTSGLIAVAKNNAAHLSLAAQLEDHSMYRSYSAVLRGKILEGGTVNAPIGRHRTDRKKMAVLQDGGRRAVTHYEPVRPLTGHTLCRMRLETGRTHQIRVHMAYMGHPVLGDPVYGGGQAPFEKKHPTLFHGQCLHAGELSFVHPSTGRQVTFRCDPPANFIRIVELLEQE
ncbi:MAG: RluA family pseudouridine synthase [Clostridiales bacterium]|jgi:23S rRNA pseudouridine1911/1915/1917 synthase|nr:RluA family pseudouridine synthase [Clostridiales bacterium]